MFFFFLGWKKSEQFVLMEMTQERRKKTVTQGRGEGLALAPSKDSSLSGIPTGSRVWACHAVASVFSGKQGRQLRGWEMSDV